MQKLNFPIFTIECEELQEEIENVLELKEEIEELKSDIEEASSEMEISGKKLNFYVNNIINYDKKFNYKNHVIIFDDLNNLYLYSYKDVKKLGFELDKETLSTKKALHTQKINIKQIERCLNLIMEHNDNFYDYEYLKDDYSDAIEEYNDIIDDVKKTISKDNFKSEDKTIVPFNEDLHELLMVKLKNDEWKFIYFEKQYKEEILNSSSDKEILDTNKEDDV